MFHSIRNLKEVYIVIVLQTNTNNNPKYNKKEDYLPFNNYKD